MIQPWQIDVDNHVRTQTYIAFATSNCLAWYFLSTFCRSKPKHCQRLNWPKSLMFSPIKYLMVISQVDQNSASDFHAMLRTRPPTDQTTVSTQRPCQGLCCERTTVERAAAQHGKSGARALLAKPNPRSRICFRSISGLGGPSIYPRQSIVKVWWYDHFDRFHAVSLLVTHNFFLILLERPIIFMSWRYFSSSFLLLGDMHLQIRRIPPSLTSKEHQCPEWTCWLWTATGIIATSRLLHWIGNIIKPWWLTCRLLKV